VLRLVEQRRNPGQIQQGHDPKGNRPVADQSVTPRYMRSVDVSRHGKDSNAIGRPIRGIECSAARERLVPCDGDGERRVRAAAAGEQEIPRAVDRGGAGGTGVLEPGDRLEA